MSDPYNELFDQVYLQEINAEITKNKVDRKVIFNFKDASTLF